MRKQSSNKSGKKKETSKKTPEISFQTDPKGADSVQTDTLMTMLQPWLTILCHCKEHVFRDRVKENVLQAFANTHARELESKEAVDKDAAESDQPPLFLSCDTQLLQSAVFAAAAGDGLGSKQLQGLYEIHEQFQKVTGVQFVDQSFELAGSKAAPESAGSNSSTV